MLHGFIKSADKLLGFIPLVSAPHNAADWRHEVKRDDLRTCLVINGHGGRGFTRHGYD